MATQADYERLGGLAVMYNADANIDRHNRKRTVPLEVISLGFARTGTLSIQEALTILGYPTYHYTKIFGNAKDADIWIEAIDAKFNGKGAFDWRYGLDQVLGDYSAITDLPSVLFWEELVENYPDAKLVLAERDEDKWARSIGVLFEGVLNPLSTYVLRFTDPFWYGRIVNLGRAWIKAVTGTTNVNRAKQNAVAAYRKHNSSIRATVPKGRLLEYQLGTGWEPLCNLLGKDVPNVPFPHRNEAATIESFFGKVIARSFRNSIFNLAVVVGTATAITVITRRYTSRS